MRVVVCTSNVCGGSPRLDGTRLTCANIATHIRNLGHSINAFVWERPDLSYNELALCLSYCARRQCMIDKPMHYCCGCSLDDRCSFDSQDPDETGEDIWLASEEILRREISPLRDERK